MVGSLAPGCACLEACVESVYIVGSFAPECGWSAAWRPSVHVLEAWLLLLLLLMMLQMQPLLLPSLALGSLALGSERALDSVLLPGGSCMEDEEWWSVLTWRCWWVTGAGAGAARKVRRVVDEALCVGP